MGLRTPTCRQCGSAMVVAGDGVAGPAVCSRCHGKGTGPTVERWYYAHNNQKMGPIPLAGLRNMLAKGVLKPADMVLREGTSTWHPLTAIAGATAGTVRAGRLWQRPELYLGLSLAGTLLAVMLTVLLLVGHGSNGAVAPGPAAVLHADEPVVAGGEKPVLVLDAGGHSAVIRAVLFTRDGRQIISVSEDKTVRLWDVATGETLRTFHLPTGPGYEGALYAADLSPDGTKLAVGGIPLGNGSLGQFVYVVGLATGQVERVFTGHKDIIAGLRFSPDGKLLASASNDGTARLYDLGSGKTLHVCEGHQGSVRRVAFAPDGQYLATTAADRTCRIWSVATGQTVAHLKGFAVFPEAVAWSPDGQTVATGCANGTVQIWERQGTLRRQYALPGGGAVFSLTYDRAGRELLYTAGTQAGLFNPATGQARLVFARHNNVVRHGSFSPDEQVAITAGGDEQQIYLWKTSDGSVVQKFQSGGSTVYAVGWRQDGKAIAWGNTNQGKTREATVLDQLDFGPPATNDGFVRTSVSRDGYSLKLLDLFHVAIDFQGQRRHVFATPFKNNPVFCMTLLPGKRAAIGAMAGLYLVDLERNQIVRELRGHAGRVFAVATSPDGQLIVSGATDQTIRIWSQEQDEPLLSLFVAGRDWIAWTPQGYYAASPYGEKLMGWQINHGPQAMGSYYPAARFHQSLYQPALIRNVVQAGSVAKALALAQQQGEPAIASVASIAQVLPPRVVLTAPGPQGHFAVQQAKLEVRAKAQKSGNQPVSAMRLLVDGRPYHGDREIRTFGADQGAEVEAAWTVDLLPGKHALAVLAESPVSKGMTPWVEVTRAGADANELPNLYVLAVGISAYPGDLALQCGHTDAIAIDQVFREKTAGVFRSVQTRLLIDRQATRTNVVEGLAWLKSNMTARDVGILFFAGHGMQDRRGRFYLVPVDVSQGDPERTCIPGAFVKQALANMPGRLIAILDACRSGAAAAGKTSVAKADDLVRDLVSEDYGVIVFSSSQGHENSLEEPATQHGLFTLSLLEALDGKADYNRDGYIYLHEAESYTFRRVPQLTQGRQHPVSGRPPHLRPFPLTKVR